jgi:hypothetical protein
MTRWYTGTDKFFMRRDNDDLGYLFHETLPKYRFQFNYPEVAGLLHKMFVDMIGQDTKLLQDIMKWQEFVTFFVGKTQTKAVTYNYDDVARLKQKTYWLSEFDLHFETIDKDKIMDKIRNRQHWSVIPRWEWQDVHPTYQKPLVIDESIKKAKHA